MLLDQVHEILQVAFGWTDSHMHQSGSGSRYHGPETEYYLCPYQVEEGEPGVPEEEVRSDEVLADPGDTLCYLYMTSATAGNTSSGSRPWPWGDTAPALPRVPGRTQTSPP